MAYQSLLKEGRIDKDVVLLHGEIYVQKEVQFDGRRLIGECGWKPMSLLETLCTYLKSCILDKITEN